MVVNQTNASEHIRPGPLPLFSSFIITASLSRYDVPARDYIASLNAPWDGIAVGALVFSLPPQSGVGLPPRVLLIQRAKTDSLPEKWEIPSGVVSNNPQKDATVAQAVARELWEETGLTAKRLVRLVAAPPAESEEGTMITAARRGEGDDGFVFSNSTKTKVFCRYVFEVDVEEGLEEGSELHVKLNPWEHHNFVWATEQEVRDCIFNDNKLEIDFTSDHLRRLILEGFRLKMEGPIRGNTEA